MADTKMLAEKVEAARQLVPAMLRDVSEEVASALTSAHGGAASLPLALEQLAVKRGVQTPGVPAATSARDRPDSGGAAAGAQMEQVAAARRDEPLD